MSESRHGLNPNFSLEESIRQSQPPEDQRKPEISLAADKMEKLIYNDTLTDFENRRGLKRFRDNLSQEDYPVSLVVFDLDNLKKINDNPDPVNGGHTAGDKYILSFVDFINEAFPDRKKFRLGGDEFLLEMDKTIDVDSIYQQLDKFNQREDSHNKLEFTCAVSNASSIEDFYPALKRADDKLVEAKKEKKTQQSQSTIPSINENQ